MKHLAPPYPEDPPSERRMPFPGGFLLANAVAALLIAFLGWHIYESHRFFGQIATEFVGQTEAVAQVRKLRWELTQAAHHVVLFGGGEDRRTDYDDATRRLEAELDADLGLPEQAPERAGLGGLVDLTRRLRTIEAKAMVAALEGRKDEALNLLHSPDYVEGTGVLCATMDAFAKSVYDRLRGRLRSHGENELVFFSVDVAVLLFAGGLWWLLGVRLHNWQARADSELGKRINAEVHLRQAQKMEALGQMAAGVGHDFKNLLSSIQGYADLASRAAARGQIDHASLDGIHAAAQQGAAVTGALLTYSHNTGPERAPFDLCLLLTETARQLRQTLPAAIEILTRSDLPPGQCRIIGDRNQLQQVLLNLATNAADAMPAGGRLTVALSEGDAGDAGPARAAARSVICLSVSDTGQGIPPEIRGRIFEPFFTTKGRGQSTGLGLAIVHAIALDHGATIDVDSFLGEGATFRLCFPRDESASVAVPAHATDLQGMLLIASHDAYRAQLLASAVGRLGLETEQMVDWRELLDALLRHRELALTVLLDADFTDCRAHDCSEAFAAAGVRPRVLIMTERDSPAVREYEDAGFMVLEQPLPLAELVSLIAKGGTPP
ncbi:two-component system sensor histidine kinase NtrB [Thiocapsa roseopersicina]|uniref:histidine kinase n=1 Tax=Thiocapsa roseopersicina TaxID=1058 RepID=A0A1H2ZAM3_THIRO|nr:ATP-binding protein [Thiocapsa roseopersicina]SDX13829.1 Histidine kinase-, DNA gyrase B-, and HSP90-like ATPase [Thiocapsa roseopersicina]